MDRFVHNKNLGDFFQHVTHHRQRVAWFARCFASHEVVHTLRFKLLLWLHDIEKYLVLPVLWSYYGERRDRAKARKFYDRMNALGAAIVWPVKLVTPKKMLDEIERAERMADVLDRHCDPAAREEFNDGANPPPLSKFLSGNDLQKVQTFANHYDQIVRDRSYYGWR